MNFVKSNIIYSVKSDKTSFLYYSIIVKTVYVDKSLKFSFVKIYLESFQIINIHNDYQSFSSRVYLLLNNNMSIRIQLNHYSFTQLLHWLSI